MKRFLQAALAATVLAAAGASAPAATISLTGNLAGDNAVKLLGFTLAADGNVTLRTWSYAGGTNAAGSPIAAGGFDPVIAIFLGSGSSALLFDGNDDGIGVGADPGNGLARDSLLSLMPLLAGTYTVALSQVANYANGPTLGDGFLGAGNPGFDGRSSSWALDLVGVDAIIAEPTSIALAVLGLVAAAGLGRTRKPA